MVLLFLVGGEIVLGMCSIELVVKHGIGDLFLFTYLLRIYACQCHVMLAISAYTDIHLWIMDFDCLEHLFIPLRSSFSFLVLWKSFIFFGTVRTISTWPTRSISIGLYLQLALDHVHV